MLIEIGFIIVNFLEMIGVLHIFKDGKINYISSFNFARYELKVKEFEHLQYLISTDIDKAKDYIIELLANNNVISKNDLVPLVL